ncbi:VOC family protein [Actinomadura xylanilytica]|uniref:VOC family protein n=1 Tax=Actinomadura xylanilytica TaxID=887459 RepID=UPI00255B3597|nr:VOC family protein [Actinomadura xylanilytica]MDL4770685.1 VOC family protein [Actinomadura xylanilytica]
MLPTTRMEETVSFYTEVLGFLPRGAIRLSGGDRAAPPRGVRFMGVNQRHHSLAVCPAPYAGDPGLVHLMVEVDGLDAVETALDRVRERGFSISSTLGRHTNDKMVSFSVRTQAAGTSSTAPRACSSTRRTTPPRRSPPTATGATTGPAPNRWRPFLRRRDRAGPPVTAADTAGPVAPSAQGRLAAESR